MAGILSPVMSVCVDEDCMFVGSANVLAVDNSLPSMFALVSLKLGRTSVVCDDDETITGGAVSERGSQVACLEAMSPRTEFRPFARSGEKMLGKGLLWD
jgi:hypothetical protein